jgi:hypothetical protein
MAHSQQDLVQIITTGGGLDINAAGRSLQDLVQLALTTSRSGPMITLRGLGGMSTSDLCQIASNSPGKVIFVLDD